MKKQLTFYFIRHGKTVWNTEGLMQGHGDSPLTEEGVNGAKKTGVALNHIPFVAAYSSVLKRTMRQPLILLVNEISPFSITKV